MKVVYLNQPFEALPIELPEIALSIGNFDGLHLGHQTLLKKTKQIAKEKNLASAALSFDPHPDEFFSRNPNPEDRIFTLDQKRRALEEFGVEYFIVQNFHEKFSKLSPSVFLKDYLYDHLGTRGVVVGENFRFGLQRKGDIKQLREFADSKNLPFESASPINHKGECISSTRVRKTLMHNGYVSEAMSLLGRPFLIEGIVGHGDKIGRKIGFPTINVRHFDQLVPANGVYSGWVWCRSRSSDAAPKVMSYSNELMLAVFNIGCRPTIESGNSELRVEAHIIGEEIAEGELYNERVGFFLCERLRDEKKFNSQKELVKAIESDRQKTIALKESLIF